MSDQSEQGPEMRLGLCSYFSRMKNFPHVAGGRLLVASINATYLLDVVTSFALLTRDLLTIAKFLVVIMLCVIATVHEFQGIEQDNMKPKQYYGNKVKVFAFESPDSGFYVLCARDGHHVALQVVWRHHSVCLVERPLA